MDYQRLLETTEQVLILRGGKGSGNWGHAGRKGKQGGSSGKRGASGVSNEKAIIKAVSDYLGVKITPDVEILDPKVFDSQFGSPDDAIHGGIAAIRTEDGKIHIKKGFEGDLLHELVHDAGALEDNINTFTNEGITQLAAKRIGDASDIKVRETYGSETKFVEEFILPVVGIPEKDFFRGYIKSKDKAGYIADLVWGKFEKELSDPEEWGTKFNNKENLRNSLRYAGPGLPQLTYLVEDLGLGKIVKMDYQMDLEKLLETAEQIMVLRGGPTSGNWGHQGRPGKHGGSKRGAGFKAIGVRGKPTRQEVKEKAKGAKEKLKADVNKLWHGAGGEKGDTGFKMIKDPNNFYAMMSAYRQVGELAKLQENFGISTKKLTLSQAQALASKFEKQQAANISKTAQATYEKKKQSPKDVNKGKPAKPQIGDLKTSATAMSHSEASNAYDGWHRNMSADERGALQWYQGNGYKTINKHLREGAAKGAMTDKNIANLDKALAKTSLPKDTILHRGTAYAVYSKQLGDDPTKWVGKVFEDKGYMSTTVNAASAFPGLKAEIRAPKGTKGGYLGNLPGGAHNGEQEILMARGTKMVITGVKMGGPTGKWVESITTEIIGQP